MKKVTAMVSAVVLCVAVGATTMAMAKTKTTKVNSKITAGFNKGSLPYAPYRQDTFFGAVSAKKGKCEKNRKVTIEGVSGLQVKTDKSGDYTIAVGTAGKGTYTAQVAKKEITKKKNNGNKIKTICKKASADSITIP